MTKPKQNGLKETVQDKQGQFKANWPNQVGVSLLDQRAERPELLAVQNDCNKF